MSHSGFGALSDRVYALYAEGRYGAALELLRDQGPAFPEWSATTAFWTACLEAMDGDQDAALLTLRHSLEEGHWWSPVTLEWDPDLDPIRSRPEFRAIVEEADRRSREATSGQQPVLEILGPDAPTGAVLIALHGGGGNASEFTPHWRAACDVGVTVAVPQSPIRSTSDSPDRFAWPEPGVEDEVAATLDRVRAAVDVDPNRIALAGYSQGGRLAISMALRGEPVSIRGALTIAAGIRDGESMAGLISSAAARGVRLWSLTGDHDFARPALEDLHTRAEQDGLQTRLTVVHGLGHAFPDDFSSRLASAIEFILAS